MPLHPVDDSFIEKVIYINLDYRLDRRASIERQLSVFSPEKCMRFSAIYNEKGYIGAAQSHMRALEIAIENNYKNLLICEDDMIWNDLEKNYCIFKYLALHKKYDVIVLGGSGASYEKESLKLYSAHAPICYLVNQHYFKTLLDNYRESVELIQQFYHPFTFGIDQYWKSLQAKGNWYIVRPCLSYQGFNFSDLDNGVIDHTLTYVPDKQTTQIHRPTSLEQFFSQQDYSLLIRLFHTQKTPLELPIHDPFTKQVEYDIANISSDQWQLLSLLFNKCITDVLCLDFCPDNSSLTILAPLFAKSRFLLVHPSTDLSVLLQLKWVVFATLPTTILLINSTLPQLCNQYIV
jgi:glycosyl transferase family 25